MIDFEKEIIGSEEEKTEKKQNSSNSIAIDPRAAAIRKVALLRRVALSLLVILFGVAFFLNRDNINLYSVRKLLNSFAVLPGGARQSELSNITYDNIDKNKFAVFKNNIVVLSSKELSIYDPSGERLYSQELSLVSPAILTGDSSLLIYDRESGRVIVHNGYAVLFDKYYDGELTLAAMNSNGYFAVVTKEKNYSAAIRVYDNKCEEIYNCFFGEKYVSSVSLSTDNKLMCVTGFDAQSGDIVSDVQVYKLSSEKPIGQITGVNGLVFASSFKRDGTLQLLTDKNVYASKNYTTADMVYDYAGKYILYFNCTDKEYTALLTSRQLTSGDSTAVLLDSRGKTVFQADAGLNVKDMSFNGKELALLADTRILAFDVNGKVSADMKAPIEAKRLINNKNNKIIVFELTKATLLK